MFLLSVPSTMQIIYKGRELNTYATATKVHSFKLDVRTFSLELRNKSQTLWTLKRPFYYHSWLQCMLLFFTYLNRREPIHTGYTSDKLLLWLWKQGHLFMVAKFLTNMKRITNKYTDKKERKSAIWHWKHL